MKNRQLLLTSFVLAAILMAGCTAAPKIEPNAFGKSKTFAIVSVSADPDISDSRGNGSSSLISNITAAASEDKGYSKDAQALLDRSAMTFANAFEKSKSFHLVPAKRILNSGSYKNAKAVPMKATLFSNAKNASGYKSFDLIRSPEESRPAIKAIINENKLDGAITIHSRFKYERSGGVSLFGLVQFGGKAQGVVTVEVRAVDRNGREIWSQTAWRKSAETIPQRSGTVSFSELEPILAKLTQEVAEQLVLFVDNSVAMK